MSMKSIDLHFIVIIIIMPLIQIQIKSFEHLLAKRHQVLTNNYLQVGIPDAAIYYYIKEASFLSKKEERWIFYFFQGLNTNPQNLSIYLRDEVQKEPKGTKERLSKGIFIIYDLFTKVDFVVQINIPGNLRIFKILGGKKEVVNNEQIDLMYLSSCLRSMYQNNLPWGKSFLLFQDSKSFIDDLRNFYRLFVKHIHKRDINLGPEYESNSLVKGSHACSLVLSFMQQRCLIRHSIEILTDQINQDENAADCPKFNILLSQMYLTQGKASESLKIISNLFSKYSKDPYLLYYQAKYLWHLSLFDKALIVANSIVQFNQLQIWILLAKIHLDLKNFSDTLICLNHASKLSKIKINKSSQLIYQAFLQLGKAKSASTITSIEFYPKVLFASENPLSILVKDVEEKYKFLIQKPFWKLNNNEKTIYNLVQNLRYRLESKKFQELLENTFDENLPKHQPILIKKGISESMFSEEVQKNIDIKEQYEDLPNFLKENNDKQEETVIFKPLRNLSIIPQIESVIQNSNYEQKDKQRNRRNIKLKRQVHEGLFKIVSLVVSESQFEKHQFENNVAGIIQVYNKLRVCSKLNSYFTHKMFKIFMQTANYKSIIILIAETLDLLEQLGIKKMDKLPYWIHKYLFFIIEEKGLNFLNETLEKIGFYDQAVIDTIQIAKKWKMKGVTY